MADFVYWVVRYKPAGQIDRWLSKSSPRESLWADRRMRSYIELLVGSMRHRGCRLQLGRRGNIRLLAGSKVAVAVAADIEVVEPVELGIVAELVVWMAQVLLDPEASAVVREP